MRVCAYARAGPMDRSTVLRSVLERDYTLVMMMIFMKKRAIDTQVVMRCGIVHANASARTMRSLPVRRDRRGATHEARHTGQCRARRLAGEVWMGERPLLLLLCHSSTSLFLWTSLVTT